MSPDEKINYRVENGIFLKDWYESFQHKPVKGRFKSPTETREILGIKEDIYNRLVKSGVLGEVKVEKGKHFVSVPRINALFKENSGLVPVNEFASVVSDGRWYIQEPQFYAIAEAHHESGIDGRKKYVSIVGAAKIARDLRRRKEMIESWPSFEELNVKSGFNFPKKIRNRRYRQMIDAGELKAQKIRMYGLDGVPTGRQFKISPSSFREVLAKERALYRAIQNGVSSSEIAAMRGIHLKSALRIIKEGSRSGDLHPTIMPPYSKCGDIGLYYLDKDEAERLASREIVVPCSKTSRKREMRKKILGGDGNSADIPDISSVPWKVERELLDRIEAGDHSAFGVLLKLYYEVIVEEAKKPRLGSTFEDRKSNLERSLYFAVHQLNGAASRVGIMNLTRELAYDSGKDDAPTWLNESRLSNASGSFLEKVIDLRGF